MTDTLQIEQMTRSEKLQAMEALWSSLSTPENDMVSPDWHADTLRETKERVDRGEERIQDWDTAKNELRSRFG